MTDWLDFPFFDYRCDACGAPFCERIHVMNLTLDRIETELCMDCLAKEYNMPPAEMADYTWDYVQARDCFKNPWESFNASACPKISLQQCFCQKTTLKP